ncbi:response regulator [Mammaliicoccus sciuri]|uniref:Two component transcriptional regulator, LytTR family n=2 Tax=Sporosarcina newyorkensis TaxID=759851 RepID=A0A1T4XHF9_9BACL|nr:MULTISPECIES: response regulator [Sporosarcina]EGQ27724.1 LytTR family two component transcriptional regulator [Sporosarcina newyorkensis 2681]MBY0220842.1 response regulator [Sporosarcina aquimarina]SKA88944.1 two component transcriptional regulator, LytTR family [Sporosarcina newyorkensis]
MNVLIVEDDQAIQKFLQNALETLPQVFNVYLTDSAAKAMNLAQDIKIDFFIVDIQLVDYKGTDLVKQLRTMPAYMYTPIVFETAVLTEELYAYRELKCFYYLVKPFTQLECQKVIQDVLQYLSHFEMDEGKIRIEQKGFIFEYLLKDLFYIESFGKKICLHIKRDGILLNEMISSYSLKASMELLDDRFVQVHKSFIINQDMVEQIDKVGQTIRLRGVDTLIPIGLKYRQYIL